MDASNAGFKELAPASGYGLVLDHTHFFSPIILLVTFAISFVSHSIISAKRAPTNVSAVQTGPGGRPLPKRMRSSTSPHLSRSDFSRNLKATFKWLSVCVLLTYIGDSTIIILQTLLYRERHWWCGQSVVVCLTTAQVFGIN